jgi:hypothetical protein
MTEEISKIQNKMINSLLIEKYVILKCSYSKIYTANQYEKKWVYSNLKGNLILCIEKNIKAGRHDSFQRFPRHAHG